MRLVAIILSLLFCLQLNAQGKNTSLDGAGSSIGTDSLCARLLRKAKHLTNKGSDSAEYVYQKLNALIAFTKNKEMPVKYCLNYGVYLLSTQQLSRAIVLIEKAERLSVLSQNVRGLGEAYNLKASYYNYLDSLDKSLLYLEKSMLQFEQLKDTNSVLKIKMNYVTLCSAIDDSVHVKKTTAEIRSKYAKQLQNKPQYIASLYFYEARHLLQQDKSDEAIKFLRKSIEVVQNKADIEMRSVYVTVLQSMANVYLEKYKESKQQCDYDSTMFYNELGFNISGRNDMHVQSSLYYLVRGSLELEKKNYKQCVSYSRAALEEMGDGGSADNRAICYGSLYKSYEQLKKLDSALYFLKANSEIEMEEGNYRVQNRINVLNFEKELQAEQQKASLLKAEKETALFFRNVIILIAVLFTALLVLGFFLRSVYIRNKARKQFSEELIKNMEQDRQKISRELHDSIGQGLLLLNMQSQEKYFSQIKPLLDEVRSISKNLSPLYIDKVNLHQLIIDLVENLMKQSKIYFSYDIQDIGDCTPKIKLHIYRIVQEVISNVLKHSGAKNCRVTLHRSGSKVQLQVADDGKGFEPSRLGAKSAFGINSIRQRAAIIGGKIKIVSGKKKGTQISLRINYA